MPSNLSVSTPPLIKREHYDYVIVGAGLFGAVFAYFAKQQGKHCLVIERRNHLAGNIYTQKIEGIDVHQYGAHIFHTSNKAVWDFVNQFVTFNRFTNSPVACYQDKLYNLPFNMNTFYQMWGVKTPQEAKDKIAEQQAKAKTSVENLEDQAIKMVGQDIYEKLIKGYTEKQWGRSCTELPASVIRRLPLRFTYDNNYFSDLYQGIPVEGYTRLVEQLLEGVEVLLNVDFLQEKSFWLEKADKVIFTGPIDEYFDYALGTLDYRHVYFKTELLPVDNFQGNAVVNYTEKDIPYTRVIEHKHFNFGTQEKTVISYEYSCEWKKGMEPYYPVGDFKNLKLYEAYVELAKKEQQVFFGGRLGTYRYYDMDKVIETAFELAQAEGLKA